MLGNLFKSVVGPLKVVAMFIAFAAAVWLGTVFAATTQ